MPEQLYHIFLVIYVAAIAGLATVSLLISVFYRRKFHQPSPRAYYVITIILAAAFPASYALTRTPWGSAIPAVQAYLLFGCGFAFMLGSLGLYATMKKVRK